MIGNSVEFAYDGNGNLTAVTDPLGRVTQFSYDGFDRVRSVKDPLNNSTVILRAEMGNLQTLRRLDSAEKLLAQSTVVTDPLGRVLSRSVRDLESNADVSYTYGYEQGGRVVTITDPLGRVSRVTKNQKGQVIQEEDAAGNSVEYLYEGGSNRVSQKIETEKIGPSGSSQTYTTKYEYVQGEKLSKIIENVGTPLQRVTTFLYDEKGNLVGSVDPAGHAISHEYDSQGRRIRTSKELENGERVVTVMAYDALNNLTSLTDSFGNRTGYTYDPLGRLSKITYPDGSTQEYGYDSAGNLLQEKQRSGTVVINGYDNGNRLISRTITKAAGVEGTSSESYLYDGLSRLTKGTNDVSMVERRYDSLSRLIEEVQDGKSVQYGYDKVGNPTSIRYPNQRLVEREFDLLNRISRVKQGSDVISTMEFLGRSYRLASKGYQNGDLVKYLYDQGRRLTGSETKNKNQAILQSFGWGYDSLDLKSFEKRIHNGGKGDAFSYDALKRLTNVTFDSPTPETPTATVTRSRAITLDKLDNILKITDNENAMVTEIIGELEGKGKALNQYSKFNDLPLEYDTNGNLSAKGSRLFAYDYRNRLIRSSRGDDAVTFTYDIFGRQTSRTDLSGTCHFFYSGDQKIEERNASGQVNKQYVWGNGIDELLRLDIYNGSSSTPYYIHTDNIGSTTAINDGSGNLVERVTYDVYGAPTFTDALGQTLKKSTIRNTTLFQGREYDYDLAIYNYRARYFDPSLGRFLQTDPLGYQDSMNLYQAFGNNAINFLDPFGLKKVIVAGFDAEGGPRNSRMARDGNMMTPTQAGEFTISAIERHSSPNKYSYWSKIKWGTPLRWNKEAGKLEAFENNHWTSDNIFPSVPEMSTYYRELYGKEYVKNKGIKIPANKKYTIDQYLPDHWIFNDFGHIAVKYSKKGITSNDIFHSTPPMEAYEKMGIQIGRSDIGESHGCIHVRPSDLDCMISKGFMKNGNKVVIHSYSDDPKKNGLEWDSSGTSPYEVHFYPGYFTIQIHGEK